MNRKLQDHTHGKIDHHDERKIPFFQGQRSRSYYDIVGIHGGVQCSRIQTEPLVPAFYNRVHLITQLRGRCPLFFKVGDQRSRSYFHKVGKRCRQDTESTISSRIIQLGKIGHHDERKMFIVFQDRRSKLKVALSHSRKT